MSSIAPPHTAHQQPTSPAQPVPPKIFAEFTGCSPCELREDLAGTATATATATDHHWVDDPAGLELHAQNTEPADEHDPTGEQLQHTDTRWNLGLDNPYLSVDPTRHLQ